MKESSNIMRKAKIDKTTQTVYCPKCNKSNFTVFRKETLIGGEILLHFAKCEECSESFIYKVNPKGEPSID